MVKASRFLLPLLLFGAAPPPSVADIVIRHVAVIDVAAARVVPGQAVVLTAIR